MRKYDNQDVVDELCEKKMKLKLFKNHPELPEREVGQEIIYHYIKPRRQ